MLRDMILYLFSCLVFDAIYTMWGCQWWEQLAVVGSVQVRWQRKIIGNVGWWWWHGSPVVHYCDEGRVFFMGVHTARHLAVTPGGGGGGHSRPLTGVWVALCQVSSEGMCCPLTAVCISLCSCGFEGDTLSVSSVYSGSLPVAGCCKLLLFIVGPS